MEKTFQFGGKILALAMTTIAFVGCSHTAHVRGSVALKHSPTEADVCLGRNEVKAGDHISIFKSVCRQRIRGREGADAPSCSKVKIGEGRILQVLDDHYSVMSVGEGIAFEEGAIVEKE
ncbi:MAG: hypothetical protein K2X47_13575 [Bdellovibrionales bacterium]|nr:hypothetical protein [Bdellovibrionales bacterium]